MALKTFFANTYLLDYFLGKETLNLQITEHSNWENSAPVNNLNYEQNDEVLQDFTKWLSEFVLSEKFYLYANEFIETKITKFRLPIKNIVSETHILRQISTVFTPIKS